LTHICGEGKKVNRNEKWSERYAAYHLGISLSHVQYLLSLVEAPKEAD